uniref:V-SNARE coiled-coil homology domain-containing protein n=1 Tax=Ditylenchus dipsaci TaxID=166011 RepID=A0A915EA43_9BILA
MLLSPLSPSLPTCPYQIGHVGQRYEGLERGERLQDLGNRASFLHASAQKFQSTASRMQNKIWWDNMKWVLILGSSVCS